MILLNRIEKYAAFFSEMQFGFQEGVGCNEASFTVLEKINHMLERGSKFVSCFRNVRKAFDIVWIDGLLYELFSEFGIILYRSNRALDGSQISESHNKSLSGKNTDLTYVHFSSCEN